MGAARWRGAVFPGLLALFALLYVWRITGVAPFEPVSSHLSNVYLTGAAVTVLSGPSAFVDASRRRRVLLVAAAFAAVNLVAEVVLSFGGIEEAVNDAMGDVNTADPVDGLAGIVAASFVATLAPRRVDAAGDVQRRTKT